MIFSASKGMYQLSLFSEKILTTRLRLPAHIAVGVTWAIVPGRAKPAWWLRVDDGVGQVETNPRSYCERVYGETNNMDLYGASTINRIMYNDLFIQAAIVIDGFYQTPLQTMTRREAINEGVRSVEEYAVLWDSINGKTKGAAWSDNPTVYRIEFHTPLAVNEAVRAVGRQAIMDAWQPAAQSTAA